MKNNSHYLLVVALLILSGCLYQDFDKTEPSEIFTNDAKVLFIGIDGLRYDLITEETSPFIWMLIQDPQSAYTLTGNN